MADNVKRPDKSLKLPESELELTMTYVIFNDILRFVGAIDEAVVSLMTNQEVRDLVLRRLLTDNKTAVAEIKDLIPSSEVTIDIFEIEDALAWVMEHVTYFFMKTATRMQNSVAKYPDMMKKMKMSSDPSETGLTPSETAIKSAGPTE